MDLDYIISALKNFFFILAGVFLSWIFIALIFQMISNWIRKSLAKICGIKFYIYATAPGVMLHEIGHVLFCIIFRHSILEVKLFSPQADGTLGYVNHGYNPNSLYQRIGNFFIGTGPIWTGLIAVFFCSYWLYPHIFLYYNEGYFSFFKGIFSYSFISHWESWLWLYLVITIISHITLSPPDLQGTKDGFIMICIVLLAACLLLGKLGNWEEVIVCFALRVLFCVLPIIILFIILFGGLAVFLQIITWGILLKKIKKES